MEGPKVPSEARRREPPECQRKWGQGRGAVAPPQLVSGAKPPEVESFFLFLDIPKEEPFFTSLENFVIFVNHTYFK